MVEISKVYSKCTACYEDLNDDDKKLNLEEDNPNYPVCLKCINNASDVIAGILGKDKW